MKNISKRLIAYALIAVMLLGAVGCSSNSGSSSSDRISTHNASVNEEVAMAAAEPGEVRSYDLAGSSEGFYTEGVADYEINSNGSTGSGTSDAGTISQSGQELTERMLIRNVSVSCETLNFAELTASIESQVVSLGGYIESKSFSGTGNAGDLRSAYYTIRVSSEALDQIVNTIGNTAVIIASNESTEDVTLSYTDMQARVESLRIEQETLNELLAQADSLDTIIVLQNELTNIRYQIESYESQLRVLENLSSYSTLSLSITEVLEETEVEEPRVKTYSEKFHEAFQDGLDATKETFEDLGLYIAEHAIGLGVKLVIAIIAVVVILVNVKKAKRKNKAKNQASGSAVPAPSVPAVNTPKVNAPAAPEDKASDTDNKQA